MLSASVHNYFRATELSPTQSCITQVSLIQGCLRLALIRFEQLSFALFISTCHKNEALATDAWFQDYEFVVFLMDRLWVDTPSSSVTKSG
jgi:hypothetical protein